MSNWQGKNILVIGAARQGLAASRYLAKQDANVMLNDNRPQSQFKDIRSDIKDLGVRMHFGGHPPELLDGTDMLCVSGGVPLELPIIQAALQKGIPLTNDSQIFMQAVKARVIGITGSAGKTTTTTLCGEIAKAAARPPAKVWVGGNIGFPLIEYLDDIRENDWVVMELSSFQLELMTISPAIAMILNITPNHLDRHKSMQAYTNAKAQILTHQQKGDIAVLNRDDAGSIGLENEVRGSLLTFGFDKPSEGSGSFLEDDSFKMDDRGEIKMLCGADALRLPGRHNLANALAACTAAFAAGFPPETMRRGIQAVEGVPHRLELVRERAGVRWINDSIATAPERVMAAVRAIDAPLVLLLGGRDKDLPWGELADLLRDYNPKVILFGEAGNLIKNVLKNSHAVYPIRQVGSLREAVEKAAEISREGECVLLSPGGTSFDAFRDFEERGQYFRKLVEELP